MGKRSKKNRQYREKGHFLRLFLYVVLLCILIACLGGVLFYSREKKQNELAEREKIIANEAPLTQEDFSNLRVAEDGNLQAHSVPSPETETAPTSEVKTEEAKVTQVPEKTKTPEETQASEETKVPEETQVPEETKVPKDMPKGSRDEETEKGSDSSSKDAETVDKIEEQADASQTEQTDVDQEAAKRVEENSAAYKELKLCVLNGSLTDGMAGHWRTELQEKGFGNVEIGNYSAPALKNTLIISDNQKYAAYMLTYFPGAEIRDSIDAANIAGNLPADELVETMDVFIVIGTDLADSVAGNR